MEQAHPTRTFLFAVADAFVIDGRGLVVVSEPGVAKQHSVTGGESLWLKKPDGTWSKAVGYPDFLVPNESHVLSISFPSLNKTEVPPQTEVWAER